MPRANTRINRQDAIPQGGFAQNAKFKAESGSFFRAAYYDGDVNPSEE